MKHRLNRRSAGFDAKQAQSLALAGVLTLAGVSGVAQAYARYGDAAVPARAAVPAAAGDADLTAADPLTLVADGVAWDLPNLDHDRVEDFVDMFTGSKRGDFSRFLQRMDQYRPMIAAKLEARGMPQDLIYMAMIESGFNPRAYSPARASGMWQFIAETGQRYGLEINLAVDERNDPERATDAALDYLQDLHERFGSWYLAAAAYNTGENRVGRIMREVTGSERGTDEDYYLIWDRLPRETRDYVPMMIAAARIAKDPDRYGFGDLPRWQPLNFDVVEVPAATQLSVIARAAETTVEEIRRLNPQLRISRTRNDRADRIRIPEGSRPVFAAAFDEVRRSEPAPPTPTTTYRIRRGDNLIGIARRHGTTVFALKQENGLRSDRIRAGSTLRIP